MNGASAEGAGFDHPEQGVVVEPVAGVVGDPADARTRRGRNMAEHGMAVVLAGCGRRGRRFWVFRHGLYGEKSTNPEWYVHGLFA